MTLAQAPPTLTAAEFAERVERAMLHIYHGETRDRRAVYTVREGSLPSGLTGRVFTTVFPYEAVMENPGRPASPHLLTAAGRVLTIDFGSGDFGPGEFGSGDFGVGSGVPDGPRRVPVATTAIRNESWHLRELAPEAFVRSDFAELTGSGPPTSATPPRPRVPDGGRRGPHAALVRRRAPGRCRHRHDRPRQPDRPGQDYHTAVGSLQTPKVMTTGHPVYDPDFPDLEGGDGRPASCSPTSSRGSPASSR